MDSGEKPVPSSNKLQNADPNVPMGTSENDVDLGHGVWCTYIAHSEAQKAKSPSSFVMTLAYCIWTPEELANRVMREQRLGSNKIDTHKTISGRRMFREVTPQTWLYWICSRKGKF